jgi:uncharacterized protein (DUF849 family)
MASRRVIVNLCPTGMVPTKEMTPHVPVSTSEIVEDVLACARAGAAIAHIHPRGPDGQPTWRPEAFAAIFEGLRDGNEDLLLNATTSGRRWNEFEKRSACLDLKGRLKPDLASLTVGSQNFAKESSTNPPELIEALAKRMQERGIKPELECFEPGMVHTANVLRTRGVLGADPLYFNLLLGSLGTSPLHPASFAAFHSLLPPDAVWSVAGIGRFQLDANLLGVALGGNVRVGLEDNLHLDRDRTVLATNLQLVERVVRVLRAMDLEPATPKDARAMLGLA